MTFADDYNMRAPQHVKLNDIADAFDDLLINTTRAASDGNHIVSVTSYTAMTDMTSTVTVADGESVLIIVTFRFNLATSADVMYVQLLRDATVLETFDSTMANGAVYSFVPIVYVDKPAAGTYTYTTQLKNATGARDINTNYRRIITMKFQES